MKTSFLNLITVLFFTCCFSFSGKSADLFSGDSIRIKELLKERAELIRDNKITKPIDRELFNLGYLPVAIVKKEVNSDQTIHFNFPLYKEIRSENKDRFSGRVISVYPEIKKLDINLEQDEVDVLFSGDITEEEINSFFKIFGYEGYQLKK